MTNSNEAVTSSSEWAAKAYMAVHLREEHRMSLSRIQSKLGLSRAELKRALLNETNQQGEQS